ncbi:MAG: O-antigen ligase family protein [Parcubacteria group bacterium]|nr:O-antigen ligase family protein [Parcubacteria group bacterium]
MGKKSRMKKEKRQALQNVSATSNEQVHIAKPKGLELFLIWIVRLGTVAILFTPLILYDKYYFPFVGPKGLYLMACAQIVFFAWLFLAIHYKKYRPSVNKILTVFVCYLIIVILSSILGADFSRSFWSKFERMTGLLIWLHLFGLFLAISSSFRKISEWRMIFWISICIGALVSIPTLLAEVGIVIYKLGGSALGNTSFLGTYLLFQVFFAIYLFFEEKNKYLKILIAIMAVASGLSIYFAGARSATLGTMGGIALIGLLYLSFKVKNRGVKIASRIALAVFSLTVLSLVILLFIPGSFVLNKFVELTSASRFINWQMAWKGFLERPMFGWGPENYIILFPKFFNPCLYTGKCGSEIWFDRTHNIVLDTLVTTGIFGVFAYLGLFVTMAFALIKKYFKQKTISFWLFSVFLALPISYFIQNLTVFDMPASLMLFILIISFIAFLVSPEKPQSTQVKPVRPWVGVIFLLVFLVTFFEFVIQPLKTDSLVIQSIITGSPEERLVYYKKALEASPMGKYQIRNFFAQHTQQFVHENLETIPKATLIKELDFVITELEKTIKTTPTDYRTTLKLAQIHNIYAILDINKLSLAEEYGNRAMALSPNHQQAYWSLAQTKVHMKEYETAIQFAQTAVDLEPEWLNSHQTLIAVAIRAEEYDKAKEFIQKALAINPKWDGEFDALLGGIPEE